MNNDKFKRAGMPKIGIGGYKCSCCGPKPKDRKKFRRRVRAVLKNLLYKGEE